MTPDPVVKESLTTERDTAYREGFEACREMAAKVADKSCCTSCGSQYGWNATSEAIRALPTPTTKGGA